MKHFTIEELTRSTTATQFGIDNSPSQESTANMRQLVETAARACRRPRHTHRRQPPPLRNTTEFTPYRIDLGAKRQMDTHSLVTDT